MDVRLVFILSLLGIVHCRLLNSCNITRSFVNGHNSRRLKLARDEIRGQPAASRMTYIVWDDELAEKAQKWASKNKYRHNSDKTIHSGRFEVGENIFWYGTTDMSFKFDPEMAMESWWEEHKFYNYDKLTLEVLSKPEPVGHFTQMAWADSYRLGCGVSQYIGENWNNFLVVCNYGPQGNYLHETPYASGFRSGRLVCHESTNCDKKYGNHC